MSDSRQSAFRNNALDNDELRKRRDFHALEIRRFNRTSMMMQKRQVTPVVDRPVDASSDPHSLIELTNRLRSNDPVVQQETISTFRRLLSAQVDPPIQGVIDAGAVDLFVHFLRSDNPNLQFEAAWALTNIASGSSEQTAVVISAGAVAIFVDLLRSPSEDVREQAVWALGNIAGDSSACRDFVISSGALKPLLELLDMDPPSSESLMRNATWTLSNFCRGRNPSPHWDSISQCLPVLAKIIYKEDSDILTDACWALSYLSDGDNTRIQALLDANICRRIVQLLMYPSDLVRTPALRTIGNIVTGTNVQTQMVINAAVLPALSAFLNMDSMANLRKEACWTISNITAGNSEQIQAVLDANIFIQLLAIIHNDDLRVQKEAAWAISNAITGGTPAQINYLIENGVIHPLCQLLDVNDTKMIKVILTALEHILAAGNDPNLGENKHAVAIELAGGMDKIEDLQQHDDDEIYLLTYNLIRMYFSDEDALSMDADHSDVSQFDSSSIQFGHGEGASAGGGYAGGYTGGYAGGAPGAGGQHMPPNGGAMPPQGGAPGAGGQHMFNF
ncbi:hypothetical protein H696_03740 [Fonticula alba]|uniref:Importin subunit alpha n=1 Tax=Fonticula alba TaxID=691883 RepID=A0A058Z5U1_FONAL|nr:hypothetical protein H696_03740 [Fonticula alba]KCV69308.1 hypothetical protein H696_03740 [Fonticula alba]|eukprot:XP_009495873.1 hypothetical protein H696_03740 [Fonticula alba]